MTTELYKVDPYRTDFSAQIVGMGQDYVVLDQTYFFPLSSSQPSDVGRVGTIAIREVVRVDDELRHVTRRQLESSVIACGDVVTCQVNWNRRYRLMRLHTAQHLLQLALQVTHGLVPPLHCVVTPAQATVRFLREQLERALDVEELQRFIDETIQSSLVAVHEPDQSLEGRRYWHIDGLVMLPCEGTHVRTTAEVGDVVVGLTTDADGNMAVYAELVAD